MVKDDNRFAIYHMKNNSYLGACLCVVYVPSSQEVKKDYLFAEHILILIKSKIDLEKINTVRDIKKTKIFINNEPVLFRISSECLLSSFGDTHCDCESQRTGSLREIQKFGEGIFILFPQEAQGNGLFYKAKELELQVNGFLPSGKFVGPKSVAGAAEILLGSASLLDKRNYRSLGTIINELGFLKYDFSLMSDNPRKREYLEKQIGIRIHSLHKTDRLITIENIGEYLSKLYLKNFILTDEEIKEIYNIIDSSKDVPERAASVLRFIREDIKLGKRFNADSKLLSHLVSLLDVKVKKQSIQDLTLFQDSEAYEEYHTEIIIDDEILERLFKAKILIGDELLRYEENYFYDLPYFSYIPCRTLKVRKIFRLNDLRHPINSELIYKIPIDDKKHLIKCIKIDQEDISNLIDMALNDYSVHFVPVFTHTMTNKFHDIKTSVKRYSKSLKTLSLMGEKNKIKSLILEMKKMIEIKEIDSPSDKRHADKNTSPDFNWEKLASEEMLVFKKYFRG